MSLPRQVAMAVIAKPGIAQRELATTLKTEPSLVATAVRWLLLKGKLRDDSPSDPRTRTLYPTETTLLDGRSNPTPRTRKPRRPPAAAKPKPAPTLRVVAPRPVRAAVRSDGQETVADFLARGGQIERLGAHQSGNPLRFDHSATEDPASRRRPVVRARPAAGSL